MENGILQLEDYVQKIKEKKLYHNEVPYELRKELSVIHAEVFAKTRIFKKRGYDATRKNFFVIQDIKERTYNNKVVKSEDVELFDSFHEYFSYLNGDIYKSACYYQFVFSENLISTYSINLKKICNKAFVQDTLAICSKINDENDIKNKKDCLAKAQKTKFALLEWSSKVCECISYADLIKVAKLFEKSGYNNWGYVLTTFAMHNSQKNIPLVVRFLLETDYAKMENLLTMLCVEYDNDSIFDLFDQYQWRKKSEIKFIIKSLKEGNLLEKQQCYYDADTDFFVVIKTIFDPKDVKYRRIKGVIKYFYKDFDEFSAKVNYDLSDCDLSNLVVENVDFSKYVINHKTKLPIECYPSPCYYVHKYYDSIKDVFVVEEQWRACVESEILKKREYKFRYFFDFIAFLENDLSNADLLLCDGLSYINDFSQINFEGALLVSSIKKKAGLLNTNEILSFPTVNVIEQTVSTELSTINNDILPHKELDYSSIRNHEKIYYISDLHLSQHIQASGSKTIEDAIVVIRKIAIEITRRLYASDVLLIVGDVSSELFHFKLFINTLKEITTSKIVFVLGNHELWGFKETPLEETISIYKEIIENANMYLLHNNIIYFDELQDELQVISENELIIAKKSDLRERLCSASVVLFGGIGFAGLNDTFNANRGIYKDTLSREEEKKQSFLFEVLYTKVRNALSERNIIVATHMPLTDWSHDIERHSGYVYLNGHTHINEFYDDDVIRVYSDNQVGYYGKTFNAKYFYVEKKYDLFVDYCDGIYEITRSQYIDFYRGKNINVNFTRDFSNLYMLKCNGYYCFIMEEEIGKISILHGGSTKIIRNESVQSCFAQMPNIIESIKQPLDKFTEIQKPIAALVKNIGGEGRIHGAIIDIDYNNHIYVNPIDLKVTGYFAENMKEKIVYGSIENLLTDRCPDLLPAYRRYISAESSTALVLKTSSDDIIFSQLYESTAMYSPSYIIKKMQRIYSNVLSVWPEKNKERLRGKGQKMLPEEK